MNIYATTPKATSKKPSSKGKTMGLVDEIEDAHVLRRRKCRLGQFLETLPPPDAQAVEDRLKNPTYQVALVHRVLRKNGYEGAESTTREHARGRCSCH